MTSVSNHTGTIPPKPVVNVHVYKSNTEFTGENPVRRSSKDNSLPKSTSSGSLDELNGSSHSFNGDSGAKTVRRASGNLAFKYMPDGDVNSRMESTSMHGEMYRSVEIENRRSTINDLSASSYHGYSSSYHDSPEGHLSNSHIPRRTGRVSASVAAHHQALQERGRSSTRSTLGPGDNPDNLRRSQSKVPKTEVQARFRRSASLSAPIQRPAFQKGQNPLDTSNHKNEATISPSSKTAERVSQHGPSPSSAVERGSSHGFSPKDAPQTRVRTNSLATKGSFSGEIESPSNAVKRHPIERSPILSDSLLPKPVVRTNSLSERNRSSTLPTNSPHALSPTSQAHMDPISPSENNGIRSKYKNQSSITFGDSISEPVTSKLNNRNSSNEPSVQRTSEETLDDQGKVPTASVPAVVSNDKSASRIARNLDSSTSLRLDMTLEGDGVVTKSPNRSKAFESQISFSENGLGETSPKADTFDSVPPNSPVSKPVPRNRFSEDSHVMNKPNAKTFGSKDTLVVGNDSVGSDIVDTRPRRNTYDLHNAPNQKPHAASKIPSPGAIHSPGFVNSPTGAPNGRVTRAPSVGSNIPSPMVRTSSLNVSPLELTPDGANSINRRVSIERSMSHRIESPSPRQKQKQFEDSLNHPNKPTKMSWKEAHEASSPQPRGSTDLSGAPTIPLPSIPKLPRPPSTRDNESTGSQPKRRPSHGHPEPSNTPDFYPPNMRRPSKAVRSEPEVQKDMCCTIA